MAPVNVSIRQMRAFVALCEQRNFTRAAETCHLSQPAFSSLVSQLETAIGARLFDRSARHVEPSAEGLEFEIAARRVTTSRVRTTIDPRGSSGRSEFQSD